MKKTLILGASTNTSRYAYIAANDLTKHKHEIVPVGIKKGRVAGVEIINHKEIIEGIDTITLYIGPSRQAEWYSYIIDTKPKRLIFNPGTENSELADLATKNGIAVEQACTLVMLAIGAY